MRNNIKKTHSTRFKVDIISYRNGSYNLIIRVKVMRTTNGKEFAYENKVSHLRARPPKGVM